MEEALFLAEFPYHSCSLGGRFDKWNQDNPDVIVKVGDRIIEVNGVRMLGGEMLGELKKQDEDLTLTLLRY
eukprot:g4997.t1